MSSAEGQWRTIDAFEAPESRARWQSRNDDIMGGKSDGSVTFEGDALVFAGALNLDGGGFASVRRELEPGELQGATQLLVRARVDERRYRITLKDDFERQIERVSHQTVLEFGPPDGDGWATATVDLSALEAKRRGTPVVAAPFRPELAATMGIIITDDNEDPFRIEIDQLATR